ncbi:AMIN-like domain-containing (lipo)protein [Corynebacterium marquesiae]
MLKVRLAATLLVAASLSGCAAHETDRTTMAASVDSSQLNPLGQANMEMKTLRPQAPSELTVTDVRIGQHEGFERVVFELDGGGTPGWFVDYADTPTQQGSGKTIDYSGETALNVNIDGVVYPFEAGKEDPRIGVVDAPTEGIVTQVVNGGTFEGRRQFVIGMNARKPYSVQVLDNPTRLVVDIRN